MTAPPIADIVTTACEVKVPPAGSSVGAASVP
jgi:hypothetical protein